VNQTVIIVFIAASQMPFVALGADLTLSCQTVTTTENLVNGKPVDRNASQSSLEITIHPDGYATIQRNPEGLVSDEAVTATPTKYFLSRPDKPNPYFVVVTNQASIDRVSGFYKSDYLSASNIDTRRTFSIREVGPCTRANVVIPKF
jgi:hypothetical protein